MPSPPLPLVQSLSPRIAVLSSEDVVQSCEANGCRGLDELLRPWEGATERVSILSSTLTPTIHPSFPVRLLSFDSIFPNPASSAIQADMVVDFISSYVGERDPDEEQHYPLTRSLLLSSRPLAAYETLNHPVGILFAVSSAEPDPMASMKRLTQQLIGVVQTIPWLDAVNLLKFYVVVHDVGRAGEDLTSANELLQAVKKQYGPHSTLLAINSQLERRAPPPSPDVHTHPSIPLPRPLTPEETSLSAISQIYASALSSLTLSPLTATASAMGEPLVSDMPATPSRPKRRKLYGSKLTGEDTQRLAALVRELVVQSLVPWMESRVREWNEIYHANRRGITGRLFGAGRKFFGSRPASPAQNAQAGYNTVKGYYPVSAIEALTRRLADFAFMLRDYRFASSIYDSLRRDFAQDRAIRYSAAATEIYGLSLLLSHPYFSPTTPPRPPVNPFTTLQHTDISSWLEQAVVTYYSSGPGLQLEALRASVLYYEAWKMIGEWRGVGAALVRAAGEAEEIAAAVMIEEAALADLRGGKDPKGSGRRRRAFNLVMAARRYETAGLKSYSRRCLTRAAEIYRSTPWTAAQDRIEYSLGRQAYASGEMDRAVQHFLSLLGRDDTGVPGSQSGPLEDMGLAYQQLVTHPKQVEQVKDKLDLPTSIFDTRKTRIISTANVASGSGSQNRWAKLESAVLDKWDRKGKKPVRLLPEQNRVSVAQGETFQVELVATNPLDAPLNLTDLAVHLHPADVTTTTLTSDPIPETSLDAHETRTLTIFITAPSPCTLQIQSVSFLFHGLLPCKQSLQKKGKRLHATKQQRIHPSYGVDRSLDVDVVSERPRLSVEVEHTHPSVWIGEEVRLEARFRNEGQVAVGEINVTFDPPGMLSLAVTDDAPLKDTKAVTNMLINDDTLRLGGVVIEPGEEKIVPLVFRPTQPGSIEILALVLYSDTTDLEQTLGTPFEIHSEVSEAVRMTGTLRDASNGGHLAVLEIANISGSSIRLDKIHGFSQQWISESPKVDDTVLLPNQTYRLTVTVKPPETHTNQADLFQNAVVDALSLLLQNKSLPETDANSSNIAEATLSALDNLTPTQRTSFLSGRVAHRFALLHTNFPSLTSRQISQIFPLFDPLDLDFLLTWSTISPSTASTHPTRSGITSLCSLRPGPAFSIVNSLRQRIASELASGSKQTRTMYEETGRLRRVLVDSVLEGSLAVEENPVNVRLKVKGGSRKRGNVVLDLTAGAVEVEMEIRNRSQGVSARWLLALPSAGSTSLMNDANAPSPAAWTGKLSHTGTLRPNEQTTVTASIWISEPGLISLADWLLDVETGDQVSGGGNEVVRSGDEKGDEQNVWVPRMSWRIHGSGGIVEVVGGSESI